MTWAALLSIVLFSAALTAIVGLVLGPTSIVVGIASRPRLVTPSSYQVERIALRPIFLGRSKPDVAWPTYPARQVRADVTSVADDWRARYSKALRALDGLIKDPGCAGMVLIPAFILATIYVLFAAMVSGLIVALFAIAAFAVAALARIASGLGCVMLRSIEWIWRRSRSAETSCPHCYYISARPAYRCPECAAVHRDIRPGRLGLVIRRCACGCALPTMVLRAAWRMEAVCQRCEQPLRRGAGVLRDVRISVFGGVGVGKTRLLCGALDSLAVAAQRAGTKFGYSDLTSRHTAESAIQLVRTGIATTKTTAELPEALSCLLGCGAVGTLLHLFDTAGEQYQNGDVHDDLGFLNESQGLIYVIDPLAVIAGRAVLTGTSQETARVAVGSDPEISYTEVVTRLRNDGVRARSQRLAIVVSKVDLLSKTGLDVPAESDAIAAWLMSIGMHNIVLAAPRDFAAVRYFAVTSVAATESTPDRDPAAPIRWLARFRGVRLPVESARHTPEPSAARPAEVQP